MITKRSRKEEGTPTSEAFGNGRVAENGHAGKGVVKDKGGVVTEKGYTTEPQQETPAQTNGVVVATRAPVYGLVEWRRGPRPALAAFCYENPETLIGGHVRRMVTALARRHVPVHLFTRQPFNVDIPCVQGHPVGDCAEGGLFEQVQEFSSRAVNAFLQQFPAACDHVTMMGYEWSGAGPLELLRGIKNNIRTILSVSTLERQRSDMTSEISKRINEVEVAALRQSQVVLHQDGGVAEVAKYWVPECAPRLVAARQPFPVAQFNTKVDAGEVKSRFQVGPVDPTILYIGDFSERYGTDVVVKAMPAILRNHNQARLILVGEGAQFWPMRVYSRYLLLDHAIRFPGSVVGTALHQLIESADLIVVPSREQTPWWPIQAAWAARRPVVATHQAAPALLEHEKDSVLIYPNEQSCVWGVERILFDPDYAATIAQQGHEKLEARFGWNNVAEQIEELMGVRARA
jgi:glycosyltransferase involved in cell wall biosynthesis